MTIKDIVEDENYQKFQKLNVDCFASEDLENFYSKSLYNAVRNIMVFKNAVRLDSSEFDSNSEFMKAFMAYITFLSDCALGDSRKVKEEKSLAKSKYLYAILSDMRLLNQYRQAVIDKEKNVDYKGGRGAALIKAQILALVSRSNEFSLPYYVAEYAADLLLEVKVRSDIVFFDTCILLKKEKAKGNVFAQYIVYRVSHLANSMEHCLDEFYGDQIIENDYVNISLFDCFKKCVENCEDVVNSDIEVLENDVENIIIFDKITGAKNAEQVRQALNMKPSKRSKKEKSS